MEFNLKESDKDIEISYKSIKKESIKVIISLEKTSIFINDKLIEEYTKKTKDLQLRFIKHEDFRTNREIEGRYLEFRNGSIMTLSTTSIFIYGSYADYIKQTMPGYSIENEDTFFVDLMEKRNNPS